MTFYYRGGKRTKKKSIFTNLSSCNELTIPLVIQLGWEQPSQLVPNPLNPSIPNLKFELTWDIKVVVGLAKHQLQDIKVDTC